jgi:hypothetical protein
LRREQKGRLPEHSPALLGWVILGLMALTILQRLRPRAMAAVASHPLLGLAAGWATGVTTMLPNAAGAIAAFYFLARKMDKITFVGTAAWFFLIVNFTKVPLSAQLGLITTSSLRFDASRSVFTPPTDLCSNFEHPTNGCLNGQSFVRNVRTRKASSRR